MSKTQSAKCKMKNEKIGNTPIYLIFCLLVVLQVNLACGQEQPQEQGQEKEEFILESVELKRQFDFGDESSAHLAIRAWEALAAKDYEAVLTYTKRCIELYSEEALRQQSSLRTYAPRGSEAKYEALNNVGVSYFIKGEALKAEEKWNEARDAFNTVIDKYSFAQYWSPKGWFWKPAEISKINLEKIDLLERGEESRAPLPLEEEVFRPVSELSLWNSGTEAIVDYDGYGEFHGRGTADFVYKIKDRKGLARAVGAGIHPSTSAFRSPEYKRLREMGRLEGSHWSFLRTEDHAANFYKWATTGEEPGVKQFFTALALEEAGLIQQAIKAYYACLVHFPKSIGRTYWDTPWYIGKAAIDKIYYLTRNHPELGMRLADARVRVKNGFDDDIENDIFIVDSGRIIRSKPEDVVSQRVETSELGVKDVVGKGKVQLVQFENGHWQLIVNGRPFLVRAVAYSPTKVGQSPDDGTLGDWMQEDHNNNERIDGPFDAWVDKNFDNVQDPFGDEPVVGDFQLMKEMGVNTIRLYHHASNKELLKELYENYGIMVMMGDFLGAYAIGSGASWHEGTDYANPEHRKSMMESVRSMVLEFKDEPYILMWVLGNENNYGVANNAREIPETYFSFVNDAARMIKSIDPDRSVAICNGDTLFLDIFAKKCPDVDIYGSNSYRGKAGFERGIFEEVRDETGKPVLIMEYGCPAFMEGRTRQVAEEAQALYHRGNWEGIMRNTAGSGVGNAIGGVAFAWLDEWWKAYEPFLHDYVHSWAGPFPDGWMHEEWLGIFSQGDGKSSPFLRQKRKVYYVYQEMWR